MLVGGLARRHGLVGIFVFQFAEREIAGRGDLDAQRHRRLEAGEEPRHLVRRLQMPLGIDGEAEARFRERAFLADAGDDVGEPAPLRHVVMHVVDGDERRSEPPAELVEEAEAARLVAAMAMDAREEDAPRSLLRETGEAVGEGVGLSGGYRL